MKNFKNYVKICLRCYYEKKKKSLTNPREPLNPNRKTDRKKETAEFLKEIIKQNNLSTKDLSEFLNVTPDTIRAYKNATREIPKEKINILKRKFNNTYDSNECEDEVFQTNYELLEFLKQFNLNENEFQCVKYHCIDYLVNQLNLSIDEEFKITIL